MSRDDACIELKTKASLKHILEKEKRVILFFTAEWCRKGKHIKAAVKALAGKYPKIKTVIVDAEEFDSVAETYGRAKDSKYSADKLPMFQLVYKGKYKPEALISSDLDKIEKLYLAFTEASSKSVKHSAKSGKSLKG